MALNFPINPASPLPELAQACIDLVPQLQQRLSVIRDFAIGTTETRIAHGLAATPLSAWAVPRASGVTYYRTRAPDSRFVYLAASTAGLFDVMVIV